MVYIFSEFNFAAFGLAALASGALFLLFLGVFGFRVSKRKKNHPDDYKNFEDKLDKRMNRQWAVMSALFYVVAVVSMVNNIPNRTEQLQKEAALVKLTEIVDSITERRFGERCAFNGASVDSTWVESDTFPCVTIGNIRIWAKGATQVNRNSVAIRRAFVVGTLKDGQAISRRAEIDFENVRWGIQTSYPATETELNSAEISALAEALNPTR
ncbi:hypothetical protein [Rhizobium sp. MHM7A]|uniref:hypothetical protein n=1 Tax=Rhizobium sp. MHM7A TaxID=2583233 RepID=UPI0011068D7D|nr:hypothetical protein [Rhizobium sp. MHM7A]TLX16731.1 hypothetical protein FFR93_05150 [Rhizobium sp. MHM7A]